MIDLFPHHPAIFTYSRAVARPSQDKAFFVVVTKVVDADIAKEFR